MPLILLDLNYTLAIVERGESRPMHQRLRTETYRDWIIDLAKAAKAEVVITTARPDNHLYATLDRIADQLDGWQPDGCYFAQSQGMPHQKKQANLRRIIADYGDPAPDWLGLESNPRTRDMYASYGIWSCPVPKTERWAALPTPEPILATRTMAVPRQGDPFSLP